MYLKEFNFERARNTQLKVEKEEEKQKKQQAILQDAAKSVKLLRKEDEPKKVNAAVEQIQRGEREQEVEIKEEEEEQPIVNYSSSPKLWTSKFFKRSKRRKK